MLIVCAYCNQESDKPTGGVNRARKKGLNVYCNLKCAGLAKRSGLTDAEKRRLKAEYDREYRAKQGETLKAKKREYFARTYDSEKAAKERKKNMPRHVEYCRQPKYKEYKAQYDQQYRAKKLYGEFWEVVIILIKLENFINVREAYQINRLHEKGATRRKRQWKKIRKNLLPKI